MEQASRGASALSSGDFASAITHYTEALTINPTAVDYCIKRSTAYTRLSPADHQASLQDAETAVQLACKRQKRELIAQSQLRRAIALFGLERFADARQCLEWAKKYNDKEKTLTIWAMKIDSKMKDLDEGHPRAAVTVVETPDVEISTASENTNSIKPVEKQEEPKGTHAIKEAPKEPSTTPKPQSVQTPASKIRHEWFQTEKNVTVTLYCKGIPKDKATVEIKDNSLEVTFPLPSGSDYNFSLDPLFSNIEPMESEYTIKSTKAEFTLVKSTPGQMWPSIEGTGAVNSENLGTNGNDPSQQAVKQAVLSTTTKNTAPAYPTSSKSGPKNWDKLASDLTKRPKKDAKEGEEDGLEEPGLDEDDGDPTTNFFKTLYKGADDDTRRAMMKSYQESNGTALSTNWAEVGKGPVETSPPDGMEAKKWDE
ncbi:hypothetical protein JMJ35_006798 [Cladonia borealis]|uniref:SGS-domain-containing protein n=1 Tax=Cladonia borealis TaxID=184061 RepID=A0AA39QYX7_9LECA|nr:hypothetical protein JMJ35_006798 [Cladonia borealis]